MSEKLSWDEIKSKYPDEWVILVEPEMDESTTTLLGGQVFDHGKDRHRMHKRLKDVKCDFSIRWTGQIHSCGFLPLRRSKSNKRKAA